MLLENIYVLSVFFFIKTRNKYIDQFFFIELYSLGYLGIDSLTIESGRRRDDTYIILQNSS